MKYNVKVKCPHCNEKIDVVVTDDPGGREIGPPSQDADFSHKCKDGNDAPWSDKEDRLFNLRLEAALLRWYMEHPEPEPAVTTEEEAAIDDLFDRSEWPPHKLGKEEP